MAAAALRDAACYTVAMRTAKTISTEEFDRRFDEGESIIEYLDPARYAGRTLKRGA